MKTTLPALNNLGSLITYRANPSDEKETCLGYLMDFTGHGIFDAYFGKVEISTEHAKAHNAALDEAMLKGLDESCQIGQGSTFYFNERKRKVSTFCGTLVSASVSLNGNSLTFHRKGRTYRGRLQKDADCFNFRRIA